MNIYAIICKSSYEIRKVSWLVSRLQLSHKLAVLLA